MRDDRCDDRRADRRATVRRVGWCTAAAATSALVVAVGGCGEASGHTADHHVERGDPGRGRAAIAAYGCGGCHAIPGVQGANGMVGPPLDHWAERRIVAGLVPNDPEHLITWLTVPQSIQPGSAMPNMGVTDGEARDIAAYLYTLR